VLRDVLQSLEAREVHGSLDLLWEAPDLVGHHVDRHSRLLRLGLQRGGEALVGEQRRVDARAAASALA
jgi:hypothetical protein